MAFEGSGDELGESLAGNRGGDGSGGAGDRGGSPRGGRCGGCGAESSHLRRGRCATCYARWVRARPVGVGAACASCGERRLVHLRYFELHATWLVLCHNCCARAERVVPLPRSLDRLLALMARERRERADRRAAWDRAASPAAARPPAALPVAPPKDERRGARRVSERSVIEALPDATDLVVELEADYETPRLVEPDDLGEITDVHPKA